MIAPDLLASLNAALREVLSNPERNTTWLMVELDRLLPGDGEIVTTYQSGGGWADPSRWIGRPRAIGLAIYGDSWVWSTSAGMSDPNHPGSDAENGRLTLLIRGEI